MSQIDVTVITTKIRPVLERNGVQRASLFGSLVRGDSNDASDVDILVEFAEDKSLLDLVGLRLELEELLGRSVDVLTFDSLNPLLKDSILAEQETVL